MFVCSLGMAVLFTMATMATDRLTLMAYTLANPRNPANTKIDKFLIKPPTHKDYKMANPKTTKSPFGLRVFPWKDERLLVILHHLL